MGLKKKYLLEFPLLNPTVISGSPNRQSTGVSLPRLVNVPRTSYGKSGRRSRFGAENHDPSAIRPSFKGLVNLSFQICHP